MTTLALIGIGAWGKNYIRTIRALPDCILPAKNIKTRDYSDLFDRSDIDGVIIATPSSTHFSIAKDFLEKGFNVLIEKPLTTSYRDALLLKNIADKHDLVAMVGHIFLYHPAVVEMKKILKKIGKVRYMIAESMDYGPVRNDVSSLWDWAPHDISIALDLLGKSPISVSAWAVNSLRPKTNLYDMCFLKLAFPGNIYVFMSIGWLSPVKKRNVVVVGEKSCVVFDDISDQKVMHIKDLGNKKNIYYPQYSQELPLTLEILEFVECIAQKRKPKTAMDSGVEIVKIIEKAEESIKQKGEEINI